MPNYTPLVYQIIFSALTVASTAATQEIPEAQDVEDGAMAWAYSVDGLSYLAEHELRLYRSLKGIQDEDGLKIDWISRWLDDFQESSGKIAHLSNHEQIIEEIVSHPLASLRMIRRFVILQENLPLLCADEIENSAHAYDVIQHVQEMENTFQLPQISDQDDAMKSILNLRFVYDLNITDLIHGKISTIQTPVGLSQEHVYEISLEAEKLNEFSEAMLWLDEVREEKTTLNLTQVRDDRKRILTKHDGLMNQMSTADKSEEVEPKQNITYTSSGGRYRSWFENLCNGHPGVLMGEVEKSKLHCFYESKLDPYWLINPLKIEVYSWNPYLIRIYDVINETMVNYLLNEDKSKMQMAKVFPDYDSADDPSSPQVTSDRQSSNVFLSSYTQVLQHLDHRIERITGLDVVNVENLPFSSEDTQVASYSFGGYFLDHLDNIQEELVEAYFGDAGNRMATFMIFLNDVRLGGHTAFTKLGVLVQPVRKSAVFWFNLLRNGEDDERLAHGGCPVIMGQKWISNKWIHSSANFQTRKCSLDPYK